MFRISILEFRISPVSALYICRESSTNSPLFMQNKANLPNAQMNVSAVKTMNYEQRTMNDANKNKPNTNPIQTQSKPIPQRDTQYAIRDTRYKPNQSRSEAEIPTGELLGILRPGTNFKRQIYSKMKPKFLNFLLKNPADTKNPPKNLMPAPYDLFTNKILVFVAAAGDNKDQISIENFRNQ